MLVRFPGVKSIIPASLTAPDSYNSLSRLRELTLSGIVLSIKGNVLSFFSSFYGQSNIVGIRNRLSNVIVTFMVLMLLIRYIFNQKKHIDISIFNIIIVVVCLAIFPVLSTFTTIMMGQTKLQYYVDNGIFMLYPLLVLIFTKTKLTIESLKMRKSFAFVFILIFAIICFQNVIFSNRAYSYQKITYDRTTLLMTQIIHDLNQIDGYFPGETEVVVIGDFDHNAYLPNVPLDYYYYELLGYQKMSITYPQTMSSFCTLMGFKIKLRSESEIVEEYSILEMVQQMPQFPTKGYAGLIDGRVVLKLSE